MSGAAYNMQTHRFLVAQILLYTYVLRIHFFLYWNNINIMLKNIQTDTIVAQIQALISEYTHKLSVNNFFFSYNSNKKRLFIWNILFIYNEYAYTVFCIDVLLAFSNFQCCSLAWLFGLAFAPHIFRSQCMNVDVCPQSTYIFVREHVSMLLASIFVVVVV